MRYLAIAAIWFMMGWMLYEMRPSVEQNPAGFNLPPTMMLKLVIVGPWAAGVVGLYNVARVVVPIAWRWLRDRRDPPPPPFSPPLPKPIVVDLPFGDDKP